MTSDVQAVLIGAAVGSFATLAATWLQSYLGRGDARERALFDARRVSYSKLLNAIVAQESYPNFNPRGLSADDEIAEFNEKLRVWRNGRKATNGLASEALLLAEDDDLKEALKEFIQSNDPNFRPRGIDELMRKELRIRSN